jgi:hypothetical protein
MCVCELEDRGRTVCKDCLPRFEEERTAKLVRAAKRTLTEMGSSADDPAQSNAARKRRVEKARQESLAWEREHGPVSDPSAYERDILPRMRAMSTRRLVAVTGLSEYYLWKLKKGQGRLHPRFWNAVVTTCDARKAIHAIADQARSDP